MTVRASHRPASRKMGLLGAAAGIAGASLLAFAPASAAPPADPSGIWTIQDENASISTSKLTDRYYVNGLRLGYTSPTDAVPGFLAPVPHALWGDGQERISFDLTQQIYTPNDTEARIPPKGDRPYAGLLLGTLSLWQDTDTSRSNLSLGLGVLGPAALGEEVQNGFHDIISQGHNNGWGTQLRNEPAVELSTGRTWRMDTGAIGPVDSQILPDLTVGLGTVRDYAQAGMTFRVGQGLDADFGTARVMPGISGGDAFLRTQNFAWYVFAGADAQAVAYDVTLDGNVFTHATNTVKRTPVVGEGEVGFALLFDGVRLTYTQVAQTQEFKHQKGGLHQFGSLALSVRF